MADAILITPGPLAQIASGIRGRLELVFPKTRFDHQWMPPKVTRQVWKTLMRKPPFVGIGFDRFHRRETTTILGVISEWTIYIAVKNERGQEGLLFGDNLAPGLFSVAEVCAAALHGFTIPDLGSIQLVSADNVTIEEDDDMSIAMAAINITVSTDLSLASVLGGAVVTPANLVTQTIAWTFGDADTASQTDTITNTGTS